MLNGNVKKINAKLSIIDDKENFRSFISLFLSFDDVKLSSFNLVLNIVAINSIEKVNISANGNNAKFNKFRIHKNVGTKHLVSDDKLLDLF